ncbi:MAG: TauD/TfdA family dioxygenase [Pseudomonadota bacterium]|nr:TauD/TfdA family dioxygenase [Pseudomonadota bacterium]
MDFEINQLESTLAAEVAGLDCGMPLDIDGFRIIKEAFLDYPVLVFREAMASPAVLAEFARQFGPVETNTGTGPRPPAQVAAAKATLAEMVYLCPDDPAVRVVTNEARPDLSFMGVVDHPELWRSEASHHAEPCQALLLHAVRSPEAAGAFEFCDMRAVYRALPTDLKNEINKRKAVHHWSPSRNPRLGSSLDAEARTEAERIASLVPEMLQPMVRTHPETARPSLYISPRFTLRVDGVPTALSDMLLKELFTFAEDERFHYRHEWRPRDLILWDNRCLNYRDRSSLKDDIRCLHRVTILGETPAYAL